MKNNFKELSHLLKTSQDEEFVGLIDFFESDKGMGTKLTANVLYFSLLDKSLNKKNGDGDAFWIEKPKHGLTKPDSIKEWLEDIQLHYLLKYSSAITIKNAFVCLYKNGLIHIDNFNRIFIKYPVDGKMLSPKFAAVAILSKKKKEKNVDEISKSNVSSETKNEDKFWENLD